MTYKKYGIVKPRVKRNVRLTWEVIIALILFVFLLYRVAVANDWLPPEYYPTNIAAREYKLLKDTLKERSFKEDAWGKAAKMSLGTLQDIEEYVVTARERAELRAKAAEKCKENEIFRFFMKFGEDEADSCIERNLKIESAISDIENKTSRQDEAVGSGTASSTSQNQQPTQNSQGAGQAP